MLWLRVAREARWNVSPDRATAAERIKTAALDLMLAPAEEGLSVYEVGGEADQREVAVRFALACRDKPDHVDFVVFPAQLAIDLGLTVQKIPSTECDPSLNARHLEIRQLNPDRVLALAAAILTSPERRVERVRKQNLHNLAADLCRADPQLRDHLKPAWEARLGPLLD